MIRVRKKFCEKIKDKKLRLKNLFSRFTYVGIIPPWGANLLLVILISDL